MDGHYLKRAAVLLFHPDPEKYVTGAFIKIGFFRTNTDLIYQDEIHGDLFSQVHKTLDLLLTKYTKALISYEGLQRVETYPVPEEALREALLNAVAHKDYASAIPIQISVYEDKIMFWNPGQLPPDWTVEKLKGKHESEPFNPDIANAFFRAGMIEAWGRGIEKIMAACTKQGNPTPTMRPENSGFWFEFPFQAARPKTLDNGIAQPESRPESQPESLELRVLDLLKKSALSKAEISSRLGHKKISGQLNKIIRRLLTTQTIEYTIPQKPNSRLQKYDLPNRQK
jgi:ATP-dependent DNA helicase RecG